ncbi:MAG TPA: hypothetical protein DCO80_12455 [Ornithinibacillus sp.]|nr:hypothetical protein [Ornithinibacillus sp.]
MSIPYEIIILSLIVGLIVSLIFSLIFKNKEKKDSGFVFFYDRLTYRRKMIRTLWLFPVLVILIFAINLLASFDFKETLIVSVFFLILFLIQLIYNYTKWKKHEK